MPNPNDRADGWINATVGLTEKHVTKEGSKQNLDGWLMYGLEGEDGVGGYTVELGVGKDVEEALDATSFSSSPMLPGASDKEDAYCFVASAVDDLGNRSDLPKAVDGCADPEDSKDAMDAIAAVEDDEMTTDVDEAMDAVDAVGAKMFSTLTAGVDTEAPTLVFTTESESPVRTATEFQVRATDEGSSGIHEDRPVMGRLSLRNADETLCGPDIRTMGKDKGSNTEFIPGTDDCENNVVGLTTITGAGGSSPLVATDVFGEGENEVGFYTFVAHAQDKAGNPSAEIERTIVHDMEAPSVGGQRTCGIRSRRSFRCDHLDGGQSVAPELHEGWCLCG